MYIAEELYVGILQEFADSRLLAYSRRNGDPLQRRSKDYVDSLPSERVRLPHLPRNRSASRCKLSDDNVRYVRDSKSSHAELARELHVSREQIRLIRMRLSRAEVPGIWLAGSREHRGGRREGAGRKARVAV
jgi:hypothetical protein